MTDPVLPTDVRALLDGLGDADEAARLAEVWALVGDPAQADPAEAKRAHDRLLGRLRASRDMQADEVTEAAQPATDPAAAAPHREARSARPAPDRRAVQQSEPVSHEPVSRVLLLGIAAAAVVSLALSVLSLGWWLDPVDYTAPAGAQLAVVLYDGSTVTLNSGSTLRAPRRFRSTRGVELVGEAFFDVQHHAEPFVVTTADAQVVVLGTRFSVRAWPTDADAGTTVALVRGSVRLTPAANPSAAIVLAPGDVRHVVSAGTPVAVEGAAALAWRQGDLVYKDRPLGDVAGDVARRFGVDVSVEPSGLRQRRVSVAFRRPASAEAVVHDLALAFGLHYRARAGGFDLFDSEASGPTPPSDDPTAP